MTLMFFSALNRTTCMLYFYGVVLLWFSDRLYTVLLFENTKHLLLRRYTGNVCPMSSGRLVSMFGEN
jgi:hypothetical protein